MKECEKMVKQVWDMYEPDEKRHYEETYDVDDASRIKTADLKPHIYKTLRRMMEMAKMMGKPVKVTQHIRKGRPVRQHRRRR
jgi:hypothetical protein